jgi:hypothetical protein
MRHLIISRVNLHMELDPYKYKETRLWQREGWESERVRLLNEWARASLKKQTCQDFTFVTLWQKGHVHPGALDNEVRIEIERTGTDDDEPLSYKALWEGGKGKLTLNYSGQITAKVRALFDGPALITNLDCDDALKYDFVEVVQREAQKYTDYTILDMQTRFQYNIRTGAKGFKSSRRGSPFLSCVEPDIKCIPVTYNHSVIPLEIPIKKIDALSGLQTLNNSNMFVTGTGKSTGFELSDYV